MPLHSSLYRWYEQNKRELPWRETTDPYKIWISEIILQQTRVVQGMAYYLRFVEHFPDVDSLAAAAEDEVLRYWQGLGYYSRARNLHRAAQTIVARHEQPFPTTFEAIRSLPGIGDYTAGAIASFAYNLPYPAMDGNVYRVVARLFDCDVVFDTSAGKKHFHHLIEQILDRENARLFNSAIMEFGALYCTPTLTSADYEGLACPHCPLSELCLAHAHHTAELLPQRKPRIELKDRYLTYIIYVDAAHRTLLHQRTEKDIWQHLYEFPLCESDHLLSAEEVQSAYSVSRCFSFDFTHVLSHQRLHARFFVCSVPALPESFQPSAVGSLVPQEAPYPVIPVSFTDIDRYALSRLTLRALEQLHIQPF